MNNVLKRLAGIKRPSHGDLARWLGIRSIKGGTATPAAIAAINTLLGLGDASSPPTFTTIANISDIQGPMLAATVVDVTSHSTGNPWRERIPTLLDIGDLNCKLFFIPGDAGHEALLDIFSGRVLRSYTITWPQMGAPVWEFQAYITKFATKEPVAGVIEADVTFAGTGLPNFSYA